MKKENNERVRWLEPEEELAIRAAVRKLCPDRMPEFDLSLHSGLRWSEQYEKLTWANVNLKLRLLTIPCSKRGKLRRVPLNDAAIAALAKLRPSGIVPGQLVCPKQTHDEHRIWWEAALREAKVQNYRWHDNRHTFASRLVKAGVDIYTVKELMGHGTIAVTMRYAHLAPSRLQSAVNRLSESFTESVASAAPVTSFVQ